MARVAVGRLDSLEGCDHTVAVSDGGPLRSVVPHPAHGALNHRPRTWLRHALCVVALGVVPTAPVSARPRTPRTHGRIGTAFGAALTGGGPARRAGGRRRRDPERPSPASTPTSAPPRPACRTLSGPPSRRSRGRPRPRRRSTRSPCSCSGPSSSSPRSPSTPTSAVAVKARPGRRPRHPWTPPASRPPSSCRPASPPTSPTSSRRSARTGRRWSGEARRAALVAENRRADVEQRHQELRRRSTSRSSSPERSTSASTRRWPSQPPCCSGPELSEQIAREQAALAALLPEFTGGS